MQEPLNSFGADFHSIGFLPPITGYIGNDFNVGSYQNLPYVIPDIGVIPVHYIPPPPFTPMFDVITGVPAHIGTFTTPTGLTLADFDATSANVLVMVDGEWGVVDPGPHLPFFDPPQAETGGPYVIDLDEILTLDASGSLGSNTSGFLSDISSYEWDLDDDGSFETNVGDDAVFQVSSNYLESLQLGVGVHDIRLKITDELFEMAFADTTLTITPEPATLSLLALGGLVMLRQRSLRV